MKKVLIAATVATLVFAPQAFAQVRTFEGFSVSANANMISATTEISVNNESFNGLGQHSTVASLQAAYGFRATDSVVLSLGGTYNLSDVEAGTVKGTYGSAAFKLQNGTSLYFEPGYLVSDKTLAYLKISYNTGTAKGDSGAQSITKDITGAGLGFGIRADLGKNLFLQVEGTQIQFDSAQFPGDTTNFKSSATVGTVGIGYKF